MKLPLAEFQSFVGFAAAFAAKRDFVPILRHLVFQKTSILAYDGGTSGTVLTVPWDFAAGFTLHVERLTQLLGAIEGVTKEIDLIQTSADRVRVVGGGFQASLASLKVDDFPFPVLPERNQVVAVSPEWGQRVMLASFSASKDETKPALRGLRATGGWIRSSDNVRITRVQQKESVDIFLPDALITRLGPRLRDVRGLAVTDNLAVLYLPTGVAFGQRLNAEFPSVDQLFVRYGRALAADGAVVGLRSDDVTPFAMALRRVLLFTADDLLSRVWITVGPSSVRVATPDGALEQAAEELPMTVVGPGAKQGARFAVDGRKFLEAWERCPRVFVGSGDTPLYFQASDKTFEHLLMRLVE